MKLGLPLKLAIGIVIVFGLLLAGMALYMPFWYRYRLYQLRSDDASKRETAADAIAARGKSAMPYIKEWLRSRGDKTVAGACLVLEKMEGETWKDTLDLLEPMLDYARSEKTDAVTILFFARKYAFELDPDESQIEFNQYKNKPVRRRNILFGIIFKSRDEFFRYVAINTLVYNHKDTPGLFFHMKNVFCEDGSGKVRAKAAWALGEIGDNRAVEPLIKALENDSDSGVRLEVALVLGIIDDPRAVEPLIRALENDSDSYVRILAVGALGNIGDKRAVEPLIRALENDLYSDVRKPAAVVLGKIGGKRAMEPLIKALENDSVSSVRRHAADALGEIGDKCAMEPLIKALENDSDSDVRGLAADALGMLGDKCVVEPLIKALENDSDSDVRESAAVALADFETAGVKDALKAARDKNNAAAAIAIAWQKGGADLETAKKMEITDIRLGVFLADVAARWGNAASIERVISDLPDPYLGLRRFHADVFARMPEGFPVYDFKANYATRKKQAAAIKKWYQKHKHRLVWNGKARRYYLRD
jgi:HEAT repeat protein